jgi:hypothetical protein
MEADFLMNMFDKKIRFQKKFDSAETISKLKNIWHNY